jgi:Smg protein
VFDILAYLVERYLDLGGYPELEQLPRQLAAAGFDSDDIEDALKWLAALDARVSAAPPLPAQKAPYVRQFARTEQHRIDVDGQGYLHFLELAGVLNATQREVVLDRILALPATEIGTDQVKLIVLMVLWNHGSRPGALILHELLAPSRPELMH